MLKEFAFTPQVFDPNAAPNDPRWREYIRALVMAIFRVPAVPPIVVSGLYWDGGESAWERTTRAVIEAIPDGELRRDAQALFTQVTKHLVQRSPGPDWPGDEEPGWGNEAAISHRREPLDRVVAQRIESVPEDAPRTALSAVMASDFWNLLHAPHEPPTSLANAVRPLRLLLRHSELLVLSMPYEPCEEFTLECVRRACQRPAGMRPLIIHVHRKAPANPAAKAAWVRAQLVGKLFGAEVHYYFWPEPYRERSLWVALRGPRRWQTPSGGEVGRVHDAPLGGGGSCHGGTEHLFVVARGGRDGPSQTPRRSSEDARS